MRLSPLVMLLAATTTHAALRQSLGADQVSHSVLFASDTVHEIEIELPYAAWFDTLSNRKESGTYVAGSVWIDGVLVDSTGVRFKGNSSYNSTPGLKKPFRLKFDAFIDDQTFGDFDGVSLGNSHKDPTFMREALAYELHRELGTAPRTSFANLRVNGELIGFYTMVEPVNRTWTENHIDGDEDGNLWKGDPHGLLTWKGPDDGPYRDDYTLETNSDEDDWSELIAFLDVLNNTPEAQLVDSLPPLLDVDAYLQSHALAMTLVNLDSYQGSGHNYYIYKRDTDDRFLQIPWDLNEAFGNFTMGLSSGQLLGLSPLWRTTGQRPLADRLLDNDLYQRIYLMHLRALMHGSWQAEVMDGRIAVLRDLIAEHVYADPNKQYRDEDFDRNLDEDMPMGRNVIFGLRPFVDARRESILDDLDILLDDPTIQINELLPDNSSVIDDEHGDYDDYLELYNASGSTQSLQGYGLTDDPADPFQWTLPTGIDIEAEDHLLLWLDGEPEEGDRHAPFSLDADGEGAYLFEPDGTLADAITFRGAEADVAYGRRTDGSFTLGWLVPSPDTENPDNAPPVIEEALQSPVFPGPANPALVSGTFEDLDGDDIEAMLVYDAGGGDIEVGMTGDGQSWTAQIPAMDVGTEVSYYVIVSDGLGGLATRPRLAPDERRTYTVGVGIAPIAINEFQADNEGTLADDEGDYDDWIELVNVMDWDVDLTGFHLSDDTGDPTAWEFPEGTLIGAGERLLVWADDDPGVNELHADFKLSADGEEVLLTGPGYTGAAIVDSVSFGPQATDASTSRWPDGLGTFEAGTPSPEASNGGGLVAVLVPDDDPVVVPSGGGSFSMQASVFNRSAERETGEAWTVAVVGPSEFDAVGPVPISIGAESYRTSHLGQGVPGGMRSGTAVYELRVGPWPGVIESVDGFEVTKE